MTVMMIRVKKVGDSVVSDLKDLGFTQVNVISYCYGKAMAVVHNDFGTRDSTDLIVTNMNDAKAVIAVLEKSGMYLSSNEAENPSSGNFIEIERPKCELVRSDGEIDQE